MRRFPSVLIVLLVTAAVVAQPTPKPPDKPKASAVKLPDGTVVFVTKSADDPNPIIEGVVLSPAEYQALLDQVEAAKKAKELTKPVPPSGVAVRGAIEARGERTIAAVTLTYTFRTSSPRTPVTLGCQRAAVVSAKTADGKLPVLTADADGMTVLAEAAGEHTVTVQAEVPVSPRTTKGEVGFDFALPKAAISTFSLTKPPADGVAKVTVGTRGGELLAATKRTTVTAESLAAKPLALGPTDFLEVSWEPPGTAPADPGLTADADVQVRVDEAQVETVAKLRLKGNAREWQLTLPPTAEVSVAAGGPIPLPAFTTTLVKPTEAGKPWLLRTPTDAPGDWLVTVTARVLRAKPTDPKSRGPFAVGPFAVGGVRPMGKVSVFAPTGIRLGFKPAADLRRQDLPAATDDDLVALFTTTAAPKAGGWLDIDARPAVGQLRVRPQHKLKLTTSGWKLESVVRVVPPQRADLQSLALDVPPEWTGVDVGPPEFAEIAPEPDGRTHTVRFATPQKAAFEFTLSAVFPVAPGGAASVPLPRFTQAEERETKLTAAVGDGLEVSGTGFGWENGQPAMSGEPLKEAGRGSATTSVSGEFDRGVGRVDLKWQAYRPELGCEWRAEVTVHPRQLSVTQTLKFVAPEGDVRAVRLRGPEDLSGVRAKPALDAVGRGEWEFRPSADPGREFVLSIQFAVPLPAGATTAAVPLLWCDSATRSEATVRVWGGGGPRADGFTGRWRETAPEPAADRDSLPWFTLTAGASESLTLTLSDKPDAGGGTVIDRGVVQAAVGADGTAAVRAIYAVRKWPGGGVELDLPGGLQDVLIDGKRAEPVRTGDRVVVPMPEAKPGATVILDVRCQGVADGDGRGGRTLVPPAVRGASYRGPVRWYVVCPTDRVPLVFDGGWDAEHRWGWRGYGVGPRPADSPSDMERWVRDGNGGGEEAATTGDAVAVRRATADPLRVTLAPRLPWLLVASTVGLLLVAGLGQLRLTVVGPAVAVAAVGVAVAAVFLPQPSAQALAAAQPGLALGGLLLGVQFGWRRYRSWRAERRPTFSRTLPAADPSSRTSSGGSVVPFEARPS
jgi:hypothetical protein